MILIYFINIFNLIVLINNTRFYPLLIFLIIIGGIIILILYFTRLTSNRLKLIIIKKIIIKHIIDLTILYVATSIKIKKKYFYSIEIYKISDLSNFNQINENIVSPIKIFSIPIIILLIIIILYIIFTLTWIAKICLKFNLPLRKLNN